MNVYWKRLHPFARTIRAFPSCRYSQRKLSRPLHFYFRPTFDKALKLLSNKATAAGVLTNGRSPAIEVTSFINWSMTCTPLRGICSLNALVNSLRLKRRCFETSSISTNVCLINNRGTCSRHRGCGDYTYSRPLPSHGSITIKLALRAFRRISSMSCISSQME